MLVSGMSNHTSLFYPTNRYPDRQKDLLNSLTFEQIDSRRSGIQPKHSNTCQWLLTHPDYLAWLDPTQASEHHGFLWIRGGPGTGKSTIMNFVYKEALKDKEKTTIRFFFNARGEQLERSTIGMYRSLLFQLLSTKPTLLKVFDEPEYKATLDKIHAAITSCRDFTWEIEILQDLLRSSLHKLAEWPLAIFVDALDECPLEQVEELIEYFEDLGEHAEQSSWRLNICFSSRYYPHVDIQYGRKLNLEVQDGHEKDIALYIRNKLKVGKSKTANDIKIEIQEKAKGIFMWVVLVVGILKEEYRGGRIFTVKKRLAALPVKLSALFRDIIRRDQTDLDGLRLCVQWILFAKRPLKLEEYYFAIVSGLDPEALQKWDKDEVSKDDMCKLVLSSSKGLAETTESQVKTVQFIHESVREFFLKDGINELWPGLKTDSFETLSHAQLQQCCNVYLSSNVLDNMPLTLPPARSNEANLLRAAISDNFPFMDYATHYIFYHADTAAKSLSQVEFLSSFPLKIWISTLNLFSAYDFWRYTPNASFLYIFAENNFAHLVKAALDLDPNIEIKEKNYKYPLFAAFANGSEDAVKAMLQTKTGRPPVEVLEQLDYRLRIRIGLIWIITSLISIKGDAVFIQLLFEIGCNFEATDDERQTSLMHAAEYGHKSVYGFFLRVVY